VRNDVSGNLPHKGTPSTPPGITLKIRFTLSSPSLPILSCTSLAVPARRNKSATDSLTATAAKTLSGLDLVGIIHLEQPSKIFNHSGLITGEDLAKVCVLGRGMLQLVKTPRALVSAKLDNRWMARCFESSMPIVVVSQTSMPVRTRPTLTRRLESARASTRPRRGDGPTDHYSVGDLTGKPTGVRSIARHVYRQSSIDPSRTD